MTAVAAPPGGSPEHFDALESREPAERERDLMQRLPRLVLKAQSAHGFARILAGVDANDVGSRAALARLPVTRKSDLKDLQNTGPPFGGLAATPIERLLRLYMSPGPIFDPEGRGEDWWRFARPLWAMGLRAGQVVQNCFSYHFTPAAFMVEGGARKIGCPVIPAGTGNSEMQLQAIAGLKPSAYAGTPSFLKIIVEKALESGADISSLKRALVSAEALPPSLRAWFIERNIGTVLQVYGTADLGSIAYETQTDGVVHPGLIVDEDVIVEIVRPGAGDTVDEGEVGEVVVTNFNADYPLIRFATGDLSAMLAGASPCGRTNLRIKGWMGRADQTTKVRGMFVHAGQVDAITKRHPEIRRARLVVHGAMGEDAMTLHCEVDDPAACERDGAAHLVATIRDITKLRGDVRFVARGSLANDGKVIEDARSYE